MKKEVLNKETLTFILIGLLIVVIFLGPVISGKQTWAPKYTSPYWNPTPSETSLLSTPIDEWKDFESKYSTKWRVEWSEICDTPTRIIGDSVSSSNFGTDIITKDNINNLAKNFINENNDLFKIDASNLKIRQIHVGDRLGIITYEQEFSNIPVFGRYTTIATKNNNIVLYKSNHCEDVSISTTPIVSLNEAINIAKKFFNVKTSIVAEGTLMIYPQERGGYVLTYKIDLPIVENPLGDEEKPHIQPSVFVDAKNKEIVDFIDNIEYEDLSGSVSGMIYPVFTHEPQIEVPFKDEWVNANGQQATTDDAGYYTISGLSGSVNVDSDLEGPWAIVNNKQEDEAHHSASVGVPGTHDWNWKLGGDDASYKQEESNAFYHTNIIHDYVTKPSLGVSELDLQMGVNVNYGSTCNAFATTESINFYSPNFGPDGTLCESTALDAGVIYHEYGHRVNRHLVSVYWPYECHTGNINEGLADYWGCTIMNDPCHSRYRYTDPSDPTGECTGRRCDTDARYPEHYSCEPHSGAEILSGAFWELRGVYGADYVDMLAVDALRLQPMSFSELVENVLIADSDTGVPSEAEHIDDICHFFYDNHGLFSLECLDHTSIGVALISSPSEDTLNFFSDEVIEITGIAYGTVLEPIQSYILEYSNSAHPDNWMSDGITTVGGEIIDDLLGTLDASILDESIYYLRLTVFYGSDQVSSNMVPITIDRHIREAGQYIQNTG